MEKIIEVNTQNNNVFDMHVPHIMQSSLWASFKKKQSNPTIVAFIQNDKGFLFYTSKVPYTKGLISFGVMTQSHVPDKDAIAFITKKAKELNLAFIKIEPLTQNVQDIENVPLIKGDDFFLKNTFILNLEPDKETLFKNFSTSTRRNIRIAQKKGVTIQIHEYSENDTKALDRFLSLQNVTTKRKQFDAHSNKYYQLMYETLKENLVILDAWYNNECIGSAMLFLFNGTCYYYNGASMHKYIDTKAINLLVYEALMYAKDKGMKNYNFWGALTHDADPHDPLYGVHMFKKGYGGTLHEYIGGYDLVINNIAYTIFTTAYAMYWKLKKFQRK